MDSPEPAAPVLAEGAHHLARHLSLDEQRTIISVCLALGAEPAGFYTPVVRGGGTMSVRMMCLGRHWNARTYTYEDVRSVDGLRPQPLPPQLAALAACAAKAAGFTFHPDICIVNHYSAASRMGLHQDKDESPASLAAGVPVVSFSIGDTARFLFGGLRRRDPVDTLLLESGDVFVFGGAARLRYHGVTRIRAGTAPPELEFDGRLNLTFRKF